MNRLLKVKASASDLRNRVGIRIALAVGFYTLGLGTTPFLGIECAYGHKNLGRVA